MKTQQIPIVSNTIDPLSYQWAHASLLLWKHGSTEPKLHGMQMTFVEMFNGQVGYPFLCRLWADSEDADGPVIA